MHREQDGDVQKDSESEGKVQGSQQQTVFTDAAAASTIV